MTAAHHGHRPDPRARHATERQPVWLPLTGEIDLANLHIVAGAIRRAIEVHRATELIIDLDQVTFLDSIGIGALMIGRTLAIQHGTAYRVINARGVVHRLLSGTSDLSVLSGQQPDDRTADR
jgi:anti-anti-sigma factor